MTAKGERLPEYAKTRLNFKGFLKNSKMQVKRKYFNMRKSKVQQSCRNDNCLNTELVNCRQADKQEVYRKQSGHLGFLVGHHKLSH